MVLRPEGTDPVEEAKLVLNNENYWANRRMTGMSHEEGLRGVLELMAFTVLRQNEMLRKFERLAEKSTNERGSVIQEFTETIATAKPHGPAGPATVHSPHSIHSDV
jgi:hypothetical protein